ncbi:uncharacterized protein LOC121958403 [Plectropomus leopardus]|uniref:uncharacterized protein LOC121958403 n=1 Tax=Plectropomus leopardus TaxID=160734 RepID=UPI001C4C9772|nr:uncharacterized protein LOC121958403 [Plectropomus leopardus]
MSVKIKVLNVLKDLTNNELDEFKWYLTNNDGEGSRRIPKCQVEGANRLNTVDCMVQMYGGEGAVETMSKILVRMDRNDLAVRFTQEKVVKTQDVKWMGKDLSCPVCSHIFTEPVTLHCGLSLCKACLDEDYREKHSRECPDCLQDKQLKPQTNTSLKSLSENFKRKDGQKNGLKLESTTSIQTSVQHFECSFRADNQSNIANPIMIGNKIGGHVIVQIFNQGSVVSSEVMEALDYDTLDNCAALPPSSQGCSSNLMASHQLLCCTSEGTSLETATLSDKTTVGDFFNSLSEVMDRYKFPPNMIYNVAGMGFTTNQTPKQVVAVSGKTEVGVIRPAERGKGVSVVCAVNATGNAAPPMFIFPGTEYSDHFITGAPPGSAGTATPSGQINENAFVEVLEHLVRHTNCSSYRPMLLVLQARMSQRAWDIAKEKGIIMLPIPPRTSHRLQPLHKTVFGSFKNFYRRALDGWYKSNPGKTPSIYQIPGCVNEAFMSAMTPRNICSGFKSTGISPFNRDIYSDADLEPYMLSDRPNPELQSAGDLPAVSASVSACAPPSGTDSHSSHAGYTSATKILPLPKSQQLLAQTRQRHVMTRNQIGTPCRSAGPETISTLHKPPQQSPLKKILLLLSLLSLIFIVFIIQRG